MRGSIRQRGETYTAYWFTIDAATGKRVQHSKGGFVRENPARPPRGDSAREFLNSTIGKVQEGVWAPNTKATIKDFAEKAWLPSLEAAVAGGSLKPTTAAFYRHLTNRHLIEHLGAVRLAELTPVRLNAFYTELLKSGRAKGGTGLSPTPVARVHVTVHRMLRDAVRWGQLQRNVADHASPPRPTKREMAPWSPNQTRLFLEATKDTRLGPLWRLLAMTGLRRGEVCGLRWTNVDVDSQTVVIERARVMAAGQVVISTPKTSASARSIGLDAVTASALRAYKARQSAERLAATIWLDDNETVFTDEHGRPLHPTAVSKLFTEAVKGTELPVIRLHDLRHGYATAALEAGAPLKVVSDRLGHASIAITADIYSHVRPEVDQALADQVADLIMSAKS